MFLSHTSELREFPASLRASGKKHPITTEAAWQLAGICGPHEISKRTVIIMANLAWLASEPPGHLSAEQKKIKEQLKGTVHGGKKNARRPKKRK